MNKIVFVVLTAILALASGLIAQVPQTLSYQGMLTDALGNPVATGNVQLSCRLYDAPVSGNLLWSETQQVAVTKGLFDTVLGSGTPLNLPFDIQYWLGLAVDRHGGWTMKHKMFEHPSSAEDIAHLLAGAMDSPLVQNHILQRVLELFAVY